MPLPKKKIIKDRNFHKMNFAMSVELHDLFREKAEKDGYPMSRIIINWIKLYTKSKDK